MKPGFAALCAAALVAVTVLPAHARSASIQVKRCHEEWKSMKAHDATGDKKYADFRRECLARQAAAAQGQPQQQPQQQQPTTGAPLAPAPGTTAAAPAPAAPPAPPASQPPAATRPSPGARGAAETPPAAAAEPVFPTAIAPQYANEKPGVARRKTCLAQFRANKATGANAGLPWLKTGGGFYTECNKRLGG